GELPTFDLNGHWNNVAYKLNDTDSLRSAEGTLGIKGNIDDYRAEISTRIEYPQVPLLDIQLNAQGNTSQLQLQPLQIGLLDGQINIESRTSWADAHSTVNSISTDFLVNMSELDPGRYWPDWPGELQGKLEGNNTIHLQDETAEWKVGIDTLVVNGQLRDYPLTLTGQAQLAAGDYRLQDVKLQSGNSRLLVNGHVGDASELDWQLDSDDLGEFLPDAAGNISSSGQLAGNINAPRVNFDIDATAITTPWLSIAAVSGKADINAASDRFTVDLDGRGLRQAEQQVDEMSLQVSGLLSQHSLKLNAVMPARSIELAGDGQWQNERWQFDLAQADFVDNLAGHWQLAEPARFKFATDAVDIEQHCWQQSPARACIAADWVAAGDWQARISADGVDLEQLKQANIDADKWAQDWEKFAGTLELELDAAGNNERIERANGELRLQNILLQPTAKAELDMPALTMTLRDESDTLVLDLAGTLAGEYPGNIDGMITLGSLNFSDIPAASLRGNIDAAIGDLSPLLELYPRFDSQRAALKLALELSGQLNTPDINGNAELAIERFGIPELGIEMDELDISIKNSTTDTIDDLQLAVRANSGPGNILVEGNIQWTEDGLLIPGLQINGEKFEIANLPEARVLVSPALELQLVNQRIDVNGTVVIPEALLQPLYVVTSVPVSGDEIIIDETKPDQPPNPWDIFANIDLNLGDDVRVVASGFEGRIAGDLKLRQTPQSVSAQGELNLVDARYNAYGQELTVDRGTIIFSGQPIDNPAIDARASRSVSDITVGVTATGSAQQPVVELFSTPSMSQANILSYMITGRPVSGGNADDGNMLLQAAT
ncbi:MAG: translocation/assembly module TamB domain-containing protein, partial [Gammaproteobacteria bacterium]